MLGCGEQAKDGDKNMRKSTRHVTPRTFFNAAPSKRPLKTIAGAEAGGAAPPILTSVYDTYNGYTRLCA